MAKTEEKAKTKKPAKTATKTAGATSQVKKHKDYLIYTKRSGRYMVRSANGKTVNGMEKTKILVDAKLVQAGLPKAKEEAAPAAT